MAETYCGWVCDITMGAIVIFKQMELDTKQIPGVSMLRRTRSRQGAVCVENWPKPFAS